ncbi:MAG: SlyX family protein [Rickettsiales bacterium]|nr:SlyX family protein [Pseudomonadota bacterium]MDA0966087.1 SlyX family protein [Pseudomonadota bacterium]MDG4544270.1 SlyX family protein [Rickettsiales bacterium]MDG4546449.1 SlyX family protein [Rickettsiales bacterium]MDG4548595.1 SlyX family protein [Rickettsiales bacterium]
MEDEIIELQEMAAHQASDIEKLSVEIYIQQKEINMLKEKLQKLESKIKEHGGDSGIRSIDEESPPPHY